MPKIDWNAPLFWYQVEYRRVRLPNEPFNPLIHEWTREKVPADQDHLVIQNTPTYQEYEFYVKAYNQQAGDGISGEASEIANLYTGFSGEDKPAIVPRNFGIKQVIDARSAVFNWSYIQENEALQGMKGKLAGFIVSALRVVYVNGPVNVRDMG